ncbi:MAG: hypothetical protein ACRCT1_10110 [Microcoleaceae cyanobacterium]
MLHKMDDNNVKSQNSNDLQGIAKALIVGFSWSYAEIYEKQKRQEIIKENQVESASEQPSNPS